MKNLLNSKYLLYFCFFVVSILMLFLHRTGFEAIDHGAISQVLMPQMLKGSLPYEPYFNYDYLIGFLAHLAGYDVGNFENFAPFIRLVETILSVGALSLLCNLLFKNDRLSLVMVVMLFLTSQSGQIDQKTMIVPFYLLAIYFFLKDRWLLAGLFVGLMFYLHLGLAVWLLIPSFFAMLALCFKKQISLKQISGYLLLVLAVILPLLIFYIGKMHTVQLDIFSINYYYYTCWYATSILLTFGKTGWLINKLLMLAILLIGYRKALKDGLPVEKIIPIIIGVFALFVVDFIFVDLLRNSLAIRLQLLRSIVFIELFSSLFLAFLLGRQVAKGNYFFFIAYNLIFLFAAGFVRRFSLNPGNLLMIFFLMLLFYELFEVPALALMAKIRIKGKLLAGVFCQPITVAVVFIFLQVLPLPIRTATRAVLKEQPLQNHEALTSSDYLLTDVANYINNNIHSKKALLVIPFLESDFEYYVWPRSFISCATPQNDTLYNERSSIVKSVLENDLNYPADKLFDNYNDEKTTKTWQMLWERVDEKTIRRWKSKYGITNVIRENEWPLNFPVLYQNRFWVVYDVK